MTRGYRTEKSPSGKMPGFTIVELLIVIIVIGILASLVLIAYNTVQEQARQAKVKHDLTEFSKAVQVARLNTNKVLKDITGNTATAQSCVAKPDGTDLAKLPRTDACWVDYLSAVKRIGDAAGTNLTDLTDPYGRPYYIDENEGDDVGTGPCNPDAFNEFTFPFKSGWQGYPGTTTNVRPYSAQCNR